MYQYKYTKYIKKINQSGGNKILDLNDNNLQLGNDVQKNVKLLFEKYGNIFSIRNSEITIPVKLFKIKIVSNELEFFELRIHQPKRTRVQTPFSICIDMKSNDFEQ